VLALLATTPEGQASGARREPIVLREALVLPSVGRD
jgi:hypothetical protein